MTKVVSPLRYPGGKSQLYDFVKHTIELNNMKQTIYCEPFSGGAGIALLLLLSRNVEAIILNDYDSAIYSFWYAIINDTEQFIKKLQDAEINITEWSKQRDIYKNFKSKNFQGYNFNYGFSTFYLNRTNRSGIITGGPIGGLTQNSKYKIDCRFNKYSLISKILNVAEFKNKIVLYNLDAIDLIDEILLKKDKKQLFTYFDPPYYKQGKKLYYNAFNDEQHRELAKHICSMDDYIWIATYDNSSFIKKIYNDRPILNYKLKYSANRYRKEEEIFFYSTNTKIEAYNTVKFL